VGFLVWGDSSAPESDHQAERTTTTKVADPVVEQAQNTDVAVPDDPPATGVTVVEAVPTHQDGRADEGDEAAEGDEAGEAGEADGGAEPTSGTGTGTKTKAGTATKAPAVVVPTSALPTPVELPTKTRSGTGKG
jgi:hypothetical protein